MPEVKVVNSEARLSGVCRTDPAGDRRRTPLGFCVAIVRLLPYLLTSWAAAPHLLHGLRLGEIGRLRPPSLA